MARKACSSMREVRGVRIAAAARMSFAKAKSDAGIGILHQGCARRDSGLSHGFGGSCRRLALQQSEDLVPRSVRNQPAVVEQQQTIDHSEKRKAMGGDDD